jgi:hypothetical protein
MTAAQHPHEVLLQQIQEEFSKVLAQSSQGIYIYQDDPHWICNERLARILGYASAGELIKLTSGSPILDALVDAESQPRVVEGYNNSVDNKIASIVPVSWKKKGGGLIKTQTIFVPFSFKGNLLTIHFVTPL